MRRILIFPGSQRRHSLNRLLALRFESLLKQDFYTEILEADAVDLPLFNQDMENDPGVLDKVIPVYERFHNANGLIVATPEYNGSISPYLKTPLIGFPDCRECFQDKAISIRSRTNRYYSPVPPQIGAAASWDYKAHATCSHTWVA